MIVGARPQFIKLAPLSAALGKKHRVDIIHTGQHYDYEMSQSFFSQLKIPEPDINLNVGSGSQGRQTGRMLIAVERTLLERKPDLVLVFGDTNSTLAGALAARKLNLAIGHIEAGLRSYNRVMPEEINRLLTDHVSDFLFCPTPTAVRNLNAEGIGVPASQRVFLVGDVMFDALLAARGKALRLSRSLLSRHGLARGRYFLLTLHRAENTDYPDTLRRIFIALSSLACPVLFPVHPRTEKIIGRFRIRVGKNIRIIPPASYLEMLCLEANSLKILTDSGGVQKEAYLLGVPCVTLRTETEWVETVHDGWNIVSGTEGENIIRSIERPSPDRPRRPVFGDGRASEKIAAIIDAL